MKTRTKLGVFLVLALLSPLMGVATPAYACEEGCTPGFWKQEQHFQFWPTQVCVDLDKAPPNWTMPLDIMACTGVIVDLGDPPQDFLVQDLFNIPDCVMTGGMLDLNGDGAPDTLLDALNYQGGDSFMEKAEILLRAATASILNGMTQLHRPPGATIQVVEASIAHACATGRPDRMTLWSELLDARNNQGGPLCPD